MEHLENLGETLLQLRTRHRFRQEYVAHKLGVSQPQYSRMERGEKDSMIGDLMKMSQLYRMDVHELIDAIITGPEQTTASLKQRALTDQGGETGAAFYKNLADHYERKAFVYLRNFLLLCQKYGLDCDSREERQLFHQQESARLGEEEAHA